MLFDHWKSSEIKWPSVFVIIFTDHLYAVLTMYPLRFLLIKITYGIIENVEIL